MENIIPIIIIVIALLLIIPMAVKIVTEYERGVIFRLGRLVGAKGPGLFLIIPFSNRESFLAVYALLLFSLYE